MVPDIRKRRVDTHLVAMVILHYSLNILPLKLYTKSMQEFCINFQNFSVYLQDNTDLLQKICNPFQIFGFF